MCGIHGVLALNNSCTLNPEWLQRMGDITVHRGPDDSGAYEGDGVLLGMRRLSIIDLEGGHQPIPNEDKSIWVVCNGEIYNFQELRKQLKQKGHTFRTGSDVEVIAHLYEEYQDDFLQHLDGMYGLALWDVKRRRLIVARDRLGIKPLYYHQSNGKLSFASEAKALLQIPGVDISIDPVALEQYLALGYTPAPFSIMKGIQKLPPASKMVCENGSITISQYWNYSANIDTALSENDWIELVREKLEKSVKEQMVSDVPLGAFLSGGIDSSSIVALMAKHSDQPIKTYSIGFDTGKAGQFYNELPYAKQIANLYNTSHKEILVKPDVASLLPKLLWHLDEPVADAAFITTFLVSEFARQDVTVILSGVGGDELFGGYRRYLGEYYGGYYNKLPGFLKSKVLPSIARKLPSDRHSALLNISRYARSFILANELSPEDRYNSYIQVFSKEKREQILRQYPENSYNAIGDAFSRCQEGDAVSRLFQVDLMTQMPDDLLMLTDKMSMATSIECRVPILSHELVELSATMPSHLKIKGRNLKYILKKTFKGILPDEILYRKKRGFGAPMGAWLKQELAGMMKSVLSQQAIESRGLFNWEAVSETIALHESNREDHTDHLLSLMNFELWCRMYLDGMSHEDLAQQLKSEM